MCASNISSLELPSLLYPVVVQGWLLWSQQCKEAIPDQQCRQLPSVYTCEHMTCAACMHMKAHANCTKHIAHSLATVLHGHMPLPMLPSKSAQQHMHELDVLCIAGVPGMDSGHRGAHSGAASEADAPCGGYPLPWLQASPPTHWGTHAVSCTLECWLWSGGPVGC